MRLPKGGRVVVVGGGPAGSFSALNLLRLSNEARLDLEVVVFESRDFYQPVPGGCNKCAGILSSTFLSSLEAFGLHLPVDIVQTELDSYILHLGETQLPIHPPDPSRRILSVYRGSGPRWGSHPLPLSFERVAITSASGYYGHRMVVVGDAAVTRLYKDGIGAAFTTAKAAIQTAIEAGCPDGSSSSSAG